MNNKLKLELELAHDDRRRLAAPTPSTTAMPSTGSIAVVPSPFALPPAAAFAWPRATPSPPRFSLLVGGETDDPDPSIPGSRSILPRERATTPEPEPEPAAAPRHHPRLALWRRHRALMLETATRVPLPFHPHSQEEER